jgi:polar amino acid transport system substrate-binding protein
VSPRQFAKGLAAAVAATLMLALAACGGGNGGGSATSGDNPLGTREKGIVRAASMGDAKPYTYTDEKGNFTGFDVELFRDVARRMGVKVEFTGQDFAAILPAVNNGQYDVGVAAIGITEARKRTVDFSNGYLVGYLSILSREGSGVTNDNTVGGKRLGVIQGTLQEGYALKNFPTANLVRFPDNNSAVSALRSKTIDAHFTDIAAAQDYAKQYQDLKIVADIPSFDAPAGFAVKKGNTALLNAINKALDEAIEDGTWLRLYKQFFPDMPVPDQYLPKAQRSGTPAPTASS